MNPVNENITIFDLSNLGILRISGDDAEAFLQGQLSNDVSELTSQGHQLTAYCNPKGRMLALFTLLKLENNDYMLVAPREILGKVTPRLKMFVMRAAVNIELDEATNVFGIQAQNAKIVSSSLGADTPVFAHSLDENRFLALSTEPPSNELVSQSDWNLLDIEQNLPQVYLQTHEALIPQSANLDIVGGVNFKKGCYPGQEIIARVKYRGKPKTRMIGASIQTTENVEIGQPVYIEGREKAAGLVANLARQGDTTLLSITVPVTHLHEGDIYLDEALTISLERLSLPYEITV